MSSRAASNFFGEEHVHAFAAIARDSDVVTVFGQCAVNEAGNSVVIFDDEDVHGGNHPLG